MPRRGHTVHPHRVHIRVLLRSFAEIPDHPAGRCESVRLDIEGQDDECFRSPFLDIGRGLMKIEVIAVGLDEEVPHAEFQEAIHHKAVFLFQIPVVLFLDRADG